MQQQHREVGLSEPRYPHRQHTTTNRGSNPWNKKQGTHTNKTHKHKHTQTRNKQTKKLRQEKEDEEGRGLIMHHVAYVSGGTGEDYVSEGACVGTAEGGYFPPPLPFFVCLSYFLCPLTPFMRQLKRRALF